MQSENHTDHSAPQGWVILPDGTIAQTSTSQDVAVRGRRRLAFHLDPRQAAAWVAGCAAVVVLGTVVTAGRLVKVRERELMIALARRAGV